MDNNRSLGKRAAPNDAVLATNPAYYTSMETLLREDIIALNLQASNTGQYGNLSLFPLDPSGIYPSEQEVTAWINTNFKAKKRNLPKGTLLYWKGTGTDSNPEMIYMVIEDASVSVSVPVKLIKSPVNGSAETLNLYNSDGTLTSDRIVNIEDNDLTIQGSGLITLGGEEAKLEINNVDNALNVTGDVQFLSQLNGVVLRGSDNTSWRITVLPGGILQTNEI